MKVLIKDDKYNEMLEVYVKDENNKARKKVGFVGVDIEHLLESVK